MLTVWRRGRKVAARGFTLIELLVVLILLSVMLTLAAPSFLTFQRNAELTSAANSFVAALSAARAEAMKRQLRTFVVPVVPGTNWASGWQVFVDNDSDAVSGSISAGANDTVITEQAALPASVGMTASSFPSDGTTAYVMFNGSGTMTDIGGTFADRSLELTNGPESRRIIANPAGRLRVCKPGETGCEEAQL